MGTRKINILLFLIEGPVQRDKSTAYSPSSSSSRSKPPISTVLLLIPVNNQCLNSMAGVSER
jgi:hypothetical protein